ncbi:unnamed protein product [Protopolystoma xenopodis]|uniref:Uncharacterized protein n=1 Tax=Protopolystoma xenopodis TaxID=117903 RepID=A0A448WP33_9PLAT|nr:unnamed protein product [Protopolystoma xenopodis]
MVALPKPRMGIYTGVSSPIPATVTLASHTHEQNAHNRAYILLLINSDGLTKSLYSPQIDASLAFLDWLFFDMTKRLTTRPCGTLSIFTYT